MAYEIYPDRFRAPDDDSYSGLVDPGLRRTSVPTPLANQLKTFNAARVNLSMTFSMTNNEFADWYEWVREHAYHWFSMPVISPHAPVDIFSDQLVRFVGDLQYDKQGDNWLSVSVPVEIMPADAQDPDVPEPEYNWSVAGSPSSPAADWSESGSPSTPAAGLSWWHLYM